MRKASTLIIALLLLVSLPLLAQERTWTKKLKDRTKRGTLSDRVQYVRGDSGKWNDDARLQHTPPIPRQPPKLSIDDWADRLLKKKNVRVTANDDNWLIFRTKQLDDNDRVWVERIERHGQQITITMNQAKWQGRYFRNFTYYKVLAVNLGKLEPGKYEAKWIIQPMLFAKFTGDGRPRGNWPKDERPLNRQPSEMRVTFTVSKGTR